MKQILIAAITFLTVTAHTNAQDKTAAEINNMSSGPMLAMAGRTANLSGYVDFDRQRAEQTFERLYPKATNVSWFNSSSGFTVRFTSNGMLHNAFFSDKGAYTGSIKYYTGKELRSDLSRQIKDLFENFDIATVKEVEYRGITAYLITIVGAATWKIIHVVDGEIEVYEEFSKI